MVDRQNIISPRVAVQDGVRYELQNVLDNLTREMIGTERAVFVGCPICEQKASVPIMPKRKLQTVVCRHCYSELKFLIQMSGKYKVRSEIGLEYVIGEERTLKENAFKK